MVTIHVMNDNSEIVHYNSPPIPLYIKKGTLSKYPNMKALCHWHDDIDFIRILSGAMYYDINGNKVLIKEGDGIMINSKQMHYGYSIDDKDCEFICILFKSSFLSQNHEIYEQFIRPVIENEHLPYLYLSQGKTDSNHALSSLDRIWDTDQKKECGYLLEILGHMNFLWMYCFRLLKSELGLPLTVDEDDIVAQKKMVSYIYQNYSSKLSLEGIASSGGVCRSKCCKIFKKYLNLSPIDFVNTYRLEVSRNMLSSTTLTITEISLACGFTHSSYYTKIFLSYMGCTPSQYRKMQTH